MTNVETTSNNETNVGLKRQIGLVSAVTFLINTIIGSGVFVWPGSVLGECGSFGMVLVVCLICGCIAFLTCLPFGELSTVVPKSGSIYIFLLTAFKDLHPFFGELPAFIYLWLNYIIVAPCYFAVCTLLLTDYVYVILKIFVSEAFLTTNEASVKYLIGALSLVLTGAVNCVSVKVYMKCQDFLAYLMLGALVFIISCGFYMHFSGRALGIKPSFEGTNWSAAAIMQSVYLGLFGYDGGWTITGITDELKNPEKNILYSIIIALAVTALTYFLLNLSVLITLTAAEISGATTVISALAMKTFGSSGAVISSGICCLCLITNIMSCMFYISRVGYMAAREGHMVKILCYLHKTQHTPIPAVVLQVLLALFYFFVGGNIKLLIDVFSVCGWMAYGTMMFTVFILRKQLPEANRPFRVPSAIPAMMGVVSIALVVFSLSVLSLYLFLVFIICLLLITAVYYVFVFKSYSVKNFYTIQKKLESWFSLVAPSEETL